MAAYVDPVNFAPDLKVPVILDEGVYDGLSPAPGALAFYNHAENTPWKRLSIEPGGHGYFTSGFRQAARTELEKFLGFSLEGRVDDSILREH
jgi:cephalosporin-C deacetylase-like acetyl esterase